MLILNAGKDMVKHLQEEYKLVPSFLKEEIWDYAIQSFKNTPKEEIISSWMTRKYT